MPPRKLPSALLITSLALFGTALALGQNAPGERFRELDRNGDGKVTRAEAGDPPWFSQFDRDGDGSITASDLRNRMEAVTRPTASQPTIKDIAYGEDPSQKLDLYLPAEPANAPVMLYIHGGGWRKGDKGGVGLKPAFFTSAGWLFASANYRLIPGGEHPKNVEDVAAAIAWLHHNAASHGGAPDQIFLIGHSAGCHLVSLVATASAPLAKQGLPLSTIKGVIALDTQAYDIPRLISETPSSLYNTVFGEELDKQRDASPLHHIEKDKEIPPFLIAYSSGMGSRPNPKRPVYANAFAETLRAAGVAAEVVDASDRNHGAINQRFGRPDDTLVTGNAKAFLDDLLRQKP